MTATKRHGRTRRLTAAAATLAMATVLSGCQITSPITTDMEYDPGDGVSVDTEFVEMLDLIVISEGDGAPGVLNGYIVNSGTKAATVNFTMVADGQSQDLKPAVKVKRDSTARTDGRTSDESDFKNPVLIPEVPVVSGGMVTIRATTENSTVSKRVPVLPPEGWYSSYTEVLKGQGSGNG